MKKKDILKKIKEYENLLYKANGLVEIDLDLFDFDFALRTCRDSKEELIHRMNKARNVCINSGLI